MLPEIGGIWGVLPIIIPQASDYSVMTLSSNHRYQVMTSTTRTMITSNRTIKQNDHHLKSNDQTERPSNKHPTHSSLTDFQYTYHR